jgi:hypothetical protein
VQVRDKQTAKQRRSFKKERMERRKNERREKILLGTGRC